VNTEGSDLDIEDLTMGKQRPLFSTMLNIYIIVLLFFIKETSQNTRNKRQIEPTL